LVSLLSDPKSGVPGCSSQGVQQIAQMLAKTGVFALPGGKGLPSPWQQIVPLGNYSIWFQGNSQQYQQAVAPIISQIGQICTVPGVTLYVDCGPAGKSVQVGPGDYPQIDKTGMPNDQLSALVINPGTTVTIFQDYNFGGAQATWSVAQNAPPMTVPCLSTVGLNKNTTWNDQASSMKVRAG